MDNLMHKYRNSNIELLRIISIVLIVLHHYVVHGFETVENISRMNQYLLGVLSLGGKLGVTCFVLISGYYMIHSKFTVKKCFSILLEVWIYSVVIGVIYFMLTQSLSLKVLLKVLFPIGLSTYWFITDYLILMVVSPILNTAIHHLEKTLYQKSIIIMIIFWTIFPMFGLSYAFDDLLWFICLYFIAGYIRLYHELDQLKVRYYFLMAFVSYFIVIISNISFLFIGYSMHIDIFLQKSMYFSALNSPFILFTGISLIIGFLSMRSTYIPLINLFSSCTLGIYLIHDNTLIRSYIWENLFKCSMFGSSVFLVLHCILSVVIVYFACCFIDIFRQRMIEKPFLNRFDKYILKCNDLYKGVYRICHFIFDKYL